MRIVICRFLCAIFLHIITSIELKASFGMMSYALNHPWKFGDKWGRAFRVGVIQNFIVLSLEIINMAMLISNNEVSDLIADFLALIIISEFDDFMFMIYTKTHIG